MASIKLDKKNFDYINNMISEKNSINSIKSFCKGFGIDTEKYSSCVHISTDKITITYRRKNYYTDFNHSKIHGTTYFN